MGNANKILSKMKNNPQDWRIGDLIVVAEKYDVNFRQPGTSHVTFSKNGSRVTVPSHKPIKAIYVKKFVKMIDGIIEGSKNG